MKGREMWVEGKALEKTTRRIIQDARSAIWP